MAAESVQPARFWGLDPGVRHLNHGSFGACPTPVLAAQSELRRRLEANPVGFMVRELEPLLDAARTELARFLGADPEGLAFLPNVTTALNTVLSVPALSRGDEVLTTDHEYNACRTALEAAAERWGTRLIVVPLPFPVASPEEITAAVLARVTSRTRLVLLDHVTSPTALILPVETLVAELEGRGITTVIDGAHSPGMLPLDLTHLGAAFYVGNCHKWICAPKGAGFLLARTDWVARTRPLVIGHGANSPRADRARFRLEFDWLGTLDPTPYLCVPEALRFMDGLFPGGWDEVRERNHALACAGRAILCERLDLAPPCPETMLGSMAAIVLPDDEPGVGSGQPRRGEREMDDPGAAQGHGTTADPEGIRAVPPADDPLETRLFDRHHFVVPVFRWQAPRRRILRISAQIYNRVQQYVDLAEILANELKGSGSSGARRNV
ncbi:MAG: aminotransferase class V-fold PLP-dependent enzyme [Candidatus Eisenbacteria bacterium]